MGGGGGHLGADTGIRARLGTGIGTDEPTPGDLAGAVRRQGRAMTKESTIARIPAAIRMPPSILSPTWLRSTEITSRARIRPASTRTKLTGSGHAAVGNGIVDLLLVSPQLFARAHLTASPGARVFYDHHRARGATHNQALQTLGNPSTESSTAAYAGTPPTTKPQPGHTAQSQPLDVLRLWEI